MRRDLRDQINIGNEAFAEMMALDYLSMDPQAQSEVMEFHEDDGVRRLFQIKLRHQDGTPTSADIKRMVEGETP